MLERIAVHGGELQGWLPLHRDLGVPLVALDGTGGGLSHDQRTLILAAPLAGYRHLRSTFYLVRTSSLSIKRRFVLNGDFAFDAISPDGRTLYFIQLNPRDQRDYAVRAFDTASGKLVPKPVVDPREPDEQMRGLPQARLMSPDGRFAYTLYTGGKEPFIHDLDTVGRTAACLDLPPLPQAQLGLRLRGRQLAVLADGTPMAFVDTVSHKVAKPGAPAPRRAATANGGGASPAIWALLAAAAAIALGTALAVGARRRRAAATR
jgi:hypothetical protein